jgi:hypothetical protein
MSRSADRLFQLLPVVYQSRDADQGYPLRALLRVVAEQVNVVEENIAQLYQNWFIETCEDWVVPYIGDLIGYRLVREAGEPAGVTSPEERRLEKLLIPRRDVANTVRHRRRKGTLALLEQLAEDAAGWPARAVEFYRLLGVAQHLNHLRLERGRTVELRDGDALDLLDGPFDRIAHTVDVRRPTSLRTRGRYDIPSIGLFVWRLRSYPCGGSPAAVGPVTGAPAYCVEEEGSHCYTFSVLGNDTPLYNRPQPEEAPSHIAEELNLPVPIRRRAFEERIAIEGHLDHSRASDAYYGSDKSLAIWAPGWPRKGAVQPIPREKIVPANLAKWHYRPQAGFVAVDPMLGRMVFGSGPPKQGVRVFYHYAFSADVGGGEYERRVPGPSLFAASHFHGDDVKDWKGLVTALGAGPVSNYLRSRFPSSTNALLLAYDGTEPSAPLRDAVLSGLNQALPDDQLFDSQRFKDIELPKEALASLAMGAQGAKLVRVNRLLLEAAYPRQIATSYAVYRVHGEGRDGAFTTINDALARWQTEQPRHAIVEVEDSGVYGERISIALGENQTLQIQAADRTRPVIRVLDWTTGPDALNIAGGRGSQFTLDGLLVAGRPVHVSGPEAAIEPTAGATPGEGDLCRLTIRHCTLVPGWGLDCDCNPARPSEPSLVLENTRTRVVIESSIVGSIEVTADEVRSEPTEIGICDSIVDATSMEGMAISSDAKTIGYARLTIARATVIGQILTHAIELAENCIFDGLVRVARRQVGCMRFCYVPPDSRTPRRYHCQPDGVVGVVNSQAEPSWTSEELLAARERERERVRPQFNSIRYGTPTCCQLAEGCAEEIVRGADDESEMGVFHDLFQPQRDANLRARLAEYTPAGTNAGVIHAS